MSQPRIRTFKPEIFQETGDLVLEERQLLFGLISLADDAGRLREVLSRIRGHVFPTDRTSDKRVQHWLEQLAVHGPATSSMPWIVRYEVATQRAHARPPRFIYLPGWRDPLHVLGQAINRPRPSNLPPPPVNGVHPAQGVFVTEPSLSHH